MGLGVTSNVSRAPGYEGVEPRCLLQDRNVAWGAAMRAISSISSALTVDEIPIKMKLHDPARGNLGTMLPKYKRALRGDRLEEPSAERDPVIRCR